MLIRLDKAISSCRKESRTEIKKHIKKGNVLIDGEVAKNAELKLNPYEHEIEVLGQRLNYEKYVYVQMNKPKGVVSATNDNFQKTCIDLLGDDLKSRDLTIAGRLDKDTEGLILLTDDGGLVHRIISPKKNIEKKYFVKVLGRLEKGDVEKFENGIVLDDGYKTLSAKLELLELEDDSNEITSCFVTIKEGKFHQIKRMFKARDKEVIYLKRLQIGELKLDSNLALGEYRQLTEKEKEQLEM